MAAGFLDWLFVWTGTEELRMRTLPAWICIIGFAVGTCTAQQAAKQTRRRFDPPSVVTATEAVYPLQSVASGTVVLEVSLDDAAKITDIRVVRGIASLTEPAESSVRQWTFQAAKLDGKPVSSRIVVAFSFVPPNVGPRI
ncbi:MAG TPA: energy transducer TonB [Candidatus Acidoferrum sp.]|nr:energy transducer TonB [Candidatus Acidoferrum sp.]